MTILLITHQMQVIQMICNKVAVMKRADRGTGNSVGCVQPASCSGDTGVLSARLSTIRIPKSILDLLQTETRHYVIDG
ncbi:MAG: hypothetical protein ACLS63_00025 [Flavonifractor plautii]